MSTTYWCVRHGNGYHSTDDPNRRIKAKPRCLEHEARRLHERDGGRLIKVTRYTREESRARAEARGEVRALEAVLSKFDEYDDAEALRIVTAGLLADARKRAGGREGGR